MVDFLEAISEFIFCKDKLQKADIIFIPGATRALIPEKVAELFKKGYAPYIAVSGKYSSKRSSFPSERIKGTKYDIKDYKSEAEFLKYVLEKNGVPEDKIFQECQSRNTFENADLIKNNLMEKKFTFKNAIICCQAFHARRIQITYSLIFPDVEFYIYPVVTQNIDRYNWYMSKKGIETVMGELERCGKYFCNSLLALNLERDE